MKNLLARLRQFLESFRNQRPAPAFVKLRGPFVTLLKRKYQGFAKRTWGLLKLFGRHAFSAKRANESQRDERVLGHVERHGQRRIAFDQCMCSQLGIRIAFRPILKSPQVKMLVLQGMGQFMSHDGLLTLKLDPIGKIKLLCFWIIVSCYLLAQQFDDKRSVLKIRRYQAKFL